MKAAVYIRRSRDEQSEYSPEAQERQTRLYAELHNHEVIGLYIDDDTSGRLTERPDFDRLIDDVRRKRVQVVIVHKLDRLARNAELMLRVVNEFERLGVNLVSVSEQIDFSTPMGRMVLTTLAGVAEYYSRNLGTETRKGLTEKAMQGNWVGGLPFGYERDRKTVKPSSQAHLVTQIFILYATGQHSYTTIADELNGAGHRAANGALFGRESIRTILRNRAYLGYVQSSGIEYRGNHTPLIDEELWNSVERVRLQRDSGNRGQGNIKLGGLLSETVRCASCGRKMWHYPQRNRQGKIAHQYYGCAGRSARTCTAPFVQAEPVEQHIFDVIKGLRLPDDLWTAVIEAAEAIEAQEREQPEIRPSFIREQLRRLNVVYRLGELDDATYLHERQRLQALLALTPTDRPFSQVRAVAAQLQSIGDLFQLADTPMIEQRAILRQLIDRCYIAAPGTVIAIAPTERYDALVGAIAVVNGGCLMGLEPTTS